MLVTVLGASGLLGQEVVACAREAGLRVRAVWRREPAAVPGLEIAIAGDLLDVQTLRRVTRDAEVVFSAVGLRRVRPWNPFSRLLSPPDLCQRLAEALDAGLGGRAPRLVVTSAAGVGDSRTRMSPILRVLCDHSKIGIAYRDLANMEAVLESSGRDCLIVRPTTLTSGRAAAWRMAGRYSLLSHISRRAVADFMVARAVAGDVRGFETAMITGRRERRRTARHGGGSAASQARDVLEMRIAGVDDQAVLDGECGDPEVVRGNGLAASPQ
jgi:nucleoside-diphosphate-sugar epimerase